MNTDQNLKKNQELFALCRDNEQENLFNDFLKKIGSCQKCGTADYVSYIVIGDPMPHVADLAIETGLLGFGECDPRTEKVNQKCRKCESKFYYKP